MFKEEFFMLYQRILAESKRLEQQIKEPQTQLASCPYRTKNGSCSQLKALHAPKQNKKHSDYLWNQTKNRNRAENSRQIQNFLLCFFYLTSCSHCFRRIAASSLSLYTLISAVIPSTSAFSLSTGRITSFKNSSTCCGARPT